MVYTIKKVDLKNSVNYKVYVERKNGKPISPLHDIPLNVNIDQQIFNMVVEIPRWSNTKWEISKKEKWNPIVQLAEKVGQGFAKTGSAQKECFRNYGVFPQTCQLSNQAHPVIKTVGEHSPLDVLDIAEAIAYTGQVKKSQSFGCFGIGGRG